MVGMLFDMSKIPRSAKLTRTLAPRSQVPQLNSSNNNSGNLNNKKSNTLGLDPRVKGCGCHGGQLAISFGLVATEGNTLTDFQVRYLVTRYKCFSLI